MDFVQGRSLDILLQHIYRFTPHLKTLSLKYHALTEECRYAIRDFIKWMEDLESLDISENLLPSTAVIDLHAFVAHINETRKNGIKLTLISDLSVWPDHFPEDDFHPIRWALSPEQWVKEQEHERLFMDILSLLNENPGAITHFLPVFSDEFQFNNRFGLRPLVCVVKIPTTLLAEKIAAHIGIKTFTDQLIKACKNSSPQNLQPNTFIVALISNVYLFRHHDPLLATELLNALVPEDCPERNECLGRIANERGDYEESIKYLSLSAEQNVPTACLEMSNMMLGNHHPDLLPFDIVKLKRYLKIAAEHNLIVAQIHYAQHLESENDTLTAYQYYYRVDATFKREPHIISQIDKRFYDLIQKKILFGECMRALQYDLIDARVQCAEKRCLNLNNTVAHSRFLSQKKYLTETLTNTLSEFCMIQVSKAHFRLLGHKFANDFTVVEQLKKYLCQAIIDSTEPNKGLLAMNRDTYAEAVINKISDFIQNHPTLGIKLEARVDQARLM